MANVFDRLSHAWNAFSNSPVEQYRPENYQDLGPQYMGRPDHVQRRVYNDRSIVTGLYTRLKIDVGSVNIRHIRVNENRQYVEDIKSHLNDALNVEANIDQGGQDFRMNIAMMLFTEGVAAIVPTVTTTYPVNTEAYDVKQMRVGSVVSWYPKHVKVRLWNDLRSMAEERIFEKSYVAIVYNPLYEVMNEPNSTLQRLIQKLNDLDAVDSQAASGKIDMIIQLPYTIKTDARKAEAEKRRKDIEMQLRDSTYGIAYTDGVEKITQLNRPVENNMMKSIEYLTDMLYSQLGLTPEVFNGTADEKTMLNYYNRTVNPILTAICEAMKRTFLSKTARSQGQSLEFFRDPFELVPMANFAELGDKLTRNEIASSNEMRAAIGWKPSDDPKANELRNKNMPLVDTLRPEELSAEQSAPGTPGNPLELTQIRD